MDANLGELLRQKLLDAFAAPLPRLTRRDTWVPRVSGKALAVIGMRRSGKTSLLWQELSDRAAHGLPREALPLVSFEDDRLAGATATLLDQLLELWFRLHPEGRRPGGPHRPCLFLDEIQLVSGWEGFVRRVIDSEPVDVVVSGSSSRMLSREIASSLRGRALEAVVFPFSFREALRHQGEEPANASRLSTAERSALRRRLDAYLLEGGFPEAQGLDARSRGVLLRSYVDSTVLRDVIERHAVRQPLALAWLVRQLLANAGGSFSVNRLHGALRSQGIAIGRDQLAALVEHLEDAFLVVSLRLAAGSLRRQQSHPRKVYPIDMGLIPLYDRSVRANLGHALETAVVLELQRRGAELSYVLTRQRHEVDLLATFPDGPPQLIQVCADLTDPTTRERELRALQEAGEEWPDASQLLISLAPLQVGLEVPANLRMAEAIDWFLGP